MFFILLMFKTAFVCVSPVDATILDAARACKGLKYFK